MYISSPDNKPILLRILCSSDSVINPVLILVAFIPDSLASILIPICALDISRLNIPTIFPETLASLAILKANVLFPKLGRAAKTIRSESCNPPERILSISSKPVVTGDNPESGSSFNLACSFI